MTENKEKMNRGQGFSMNFSGPGVNMDHPMTQRMKNNQKQASQKKKRSKIQKRTFPSMVANFVIGQIGKCRHKLISLTSTRN
jgi:hypothetical protein